MVILRSLIVANLWLQFFAMLVLANPTCPYTGRIFYCEIL